MEVIMADKLKIVGYVRVSTTVSAEEGESLNIQKEQIQEFAKYHKWKLTEIYEDPGISGAKIELRPAFKKLIKDAHKKKFDGVVVSKMTRCARNARELLNFVHDLDQNGIRFFTIAENIDSQHTYTGKLLMQILAAIAEWDRENIESTMKEGKQRKWKDKRCFIGQPPYTYRWDKQYNMLRINSEEQAVYNKIVDMYLNLGLSYKDISLKLADEGIYSKRGKIFSSVMISHILKHRAYFGDYVVNKYVYKDGRRTNKLKPESEWIRYDIEPIITKTRWDQIQEKIEFNKSKAKRTTSADSYWLRDILKCAECGGVVKPHHGVKSKKTGKFPRYYSCYWSRCSPKILKMNNRKKCHLPLMKADALERKIWLKVNMKLALGKDERHLSRLIDPAKYDKQLKQLNNKIFNLKNHHKKAVTAKSRIYDIYEIGGFDKNELSRRLNLRNDEILELEAKISDTRQEISELKEAKKNDQIWKNFVENETETLRGLKKDIYLLVPDDKKRVIESMTNSSDIRIFGDKREDYWLPAPYKLRFNQSVLLDLINQGKLPSLNKNGLNPSSYNEISGPKQNRKNKQ